MLYVRSFVVSALMSPLKEKTICVVKESAHKQWVIYFAILPFCHFSINFYSFALILLWMIAFTLYKICNVSIQ